MEMFRNLIREIGVFMICAQAVIHFRPKEAYGKYLRLLLGVMVMVQIFAPVYEGIFGRTGENLTENIMGYKKELEEMIENLEPHIDDPDVKGMGGSRFFVLMKCYFLIFFCQKDYFLKIAINHCHHAFLS